MRPQPGFQERALSTPADIAVIGGSAGGGKSVILLMEGTRHVANKDFGFEIFRRTTPQITNQGALWDTSMKIFPLVKGTPTQSRLKWTFPSGAKGKFSHLEHEDDKLNYQGSQIPYIGFDELTHFTSSQFWYLLSRNRSDCGVRPYMRGSCNPDPSSWVARLVDQWIMPDGYPDPEQQRIGKIRYLTRDGDSIVWGDTWQEVYEKCPHIFNNKELKESGVKISDLIKSFTFVAGNIFENKIFIKQDPSYLGSLLSLPEEEKLRLLGGNWKVSLDGLLIPDYYKVAEIFSNYPEQNLYAEKIITCDAARFGRDFCVIFVWKGWEVIHTVVIKKSDANDVVGIIEGLRQKFSVIRSNCIIDQNGVGGGVVKLGMYTGFNNGAPAVKDLDTKTAKVRENYYNLKTQCYYRFCEMRINPGQVRFSINNENCQIYDDSQLKPVYSTKIKVGNKVEDVRDLIMADFRSVKRAENEEGKIKMIDKEEQKNLLGGRSPDFSDTAMMREWHELKPKPKNISLVN